MKHRHSLLLVALLLGACATKPVPHKPAPSVAPIKQDVARADAATTKASGHVATAQTYAQRNDDKAVVVLEYLRHRNRKAQ